MKLVALSIRDPNVTRRLEATGNHVVNISLGSSIPNLKRSAGKAIPVNGFMIVANHV